MHTLILSDDEVGPKGLAEARALLAKARTQDHVIVFFAGHGFLSGDLKYYFATAKTDPEHPEQQGLSYDAVSGLFSSTRARRRLLMLDTCHAGDVIEGDLASGDEKISDRVIARPIRGMARKSSRGDSKRMTTVKALFADTRLANGAVVVGAAGGREFSYESPELRNGVFTFATIDGLTTGRADLDGNGAISVEELQSYVAKRVVELTSGRQQPVARQVNLDLVFDVL